MRTQAHCHGSHLNENIPPLTPTPLHDLVPLYNETSIQSYLYLLALLPLFPFSLEPTSISFGSIIPLQQLLSRTSNAFLL